MLCNEKKLHLAGIGLKDVNETQYEALMQEDKVQNWATGNQLYAVKRRRDLKAVSNTTREIQPGRWWKDEVDLAEKQELQRRLDEVKQNMAVLREENTSTKKEAEENHAQRESILAVTEDLKEQKKVLQKEFSEYQAIPAKLEHEKKLGVKKQDELESCRAVIIDLEVQCDKAVLETARAGLKYQQNIANMHDAQQALIEGQIREIEARSDFEGLKDKNTTLVKRLDHEKMKIVEVEREKQTSKAEAKEAHEKVKEMCIQAADPTERQVYLTEMAAGKTLEDIDNEIKAESAKLELLHANPNAMRDYDKRAKDIEKIRREMEEAQSKSDQQMRQITRLREKWEPKLEELVRQINDAFAYNFEQINCGGEVRIHKDEDFDQWALDIMVKFRQSETLQKLDQHRQSGGERASMARSPFRVVDEINQGMDLRNERMVHERMVEIACREHTSQYFLITPKLLTGLRYDERMRVLCIASGEHMPTEGKKLDFGRCLQIHKRSIGAAALGVGQFGRIVHRGLL
ncbi:Structural maintenance of chromosomes protein 5 like [Verticillium longisporum]|nr:Structural maintenance of chromosomes protein 5 like [Verticillium longisporum]